MDRQFTATTFIVEAGKTLLIWHKKIKCWMPPGGHMEEGETPSQAALREVKEETGLDVELIYKNNFEASHVKAIPLPYMVQLEDAIGDPDHPHQHIDFIYVAKPLKGDMIDGRWFTVEEIKNLKEMLPDAREIALHLLCDAFLFESR